MVTGKDGIDQKAAHSGYREHVFNNERTTHNARDQRYDRVCDRNQGIAECVAHGGLRARETFGAGKQEIL